MRHPIRLAAAAAALLLLAVLLGGAVGSRAEAGTKALARPMGLLRVPRTAQRVQAGDGTPLTYHGGAVLHDSTTYPIFWTPPGYPMTAAYQAEVTKYFQDVAAASGSLSTPYSVSTQYFGDAGPITTQSTFGGPIVLTDPAPANACSVTPRIEPDAPITLCVLQHTLVALVQHAAALRGISPGQNAVFFVLTPPGIANCGERAISCSYRDFAAYHSVTPEGLLYAVHPSFTPARIEALAHEHIETITDPDGGGWYTDSTGQEIADLCQDDPTVAQALGSTTYTLTQEWSNADGGCAAKAPPATSRLTLDTGGEGTGQVSAVFSGQTLTCKSARGDTSCRTVVRRGAQIALKAVADAGFAFGSWDTAAPCSSKTRATCSFKAGAAEARATASFASGDRFLLSIDVSGRGAVVYPNGKKCRTTCIQSFRSGTAVTLRALPAKGWRLQKFVDDTRSCAKRPRCVIRLRDNDNVFATFVRA
ncbi:MAG: hypothetical protein QOE29_1116 [Gaiellaceae bacterium]|nr:hypothetical protein [Gaiellaceae bacterium]